MKKPRVTTITITSDFEIGEGVDIKFDGAKLSQFATESLVNKLLRDRSIERVTLSGR